MQRIKKVQSWLWKPHLLPTHLTKKFWQRSKGGWRKSTWQKKKPGSWGAICIRLDKFFNLGSWQKNLCFWRMWVSYWQNGSSSACCFLDKRKPFEAQLSLTKGLLPKAFDPSTLNIAGKQRVARVMGRHGKGSWSWMYVYIYIYRGAWYHWMCIFQEYIYIYILYVCNIHGICNIYIYIYGTHTCIYIYTQNSGFQCISSWGKKLHKGYHMVSNHFTWRSWGLF